MAGSVILSLQGGTGLQLNPEPSDRHAGQGVPVQSLAKVQSRQILNTSNGWQLNEGQRAHININVY